MKAHLRSLALNLILTGILLGATITTPDPQGMWEFWHGFIARLPGHVLRGLHFLVDIATPLW